MPWYNPVHCQSSELQKTDVTATKDNVANNKGIAQKPLVWEVFGPLKPLA